MASTDKIVLDLDAVERKPDEIKPPFTFAWKGRTITLTDPADLDWQSLLEIEHPLGFLRHCASQEDRDFLASDEGKMEGWRIGRLIESFGQHYGLDKNREKKLGF